MKGRPPGDTDALERRIGYAFADRGLLEEALTHVSRAGEGLSYQRLEFLGDRVLGLAVADLLMETCPGASEGELSRRLAELVRRETCAAVAAEWDLGPHLRITGGRNMRRTPSVLADSCEAVIGAVFRDGGFGAARAVVVRSFGPRLGALDEVPANPKTVLQEWAAALGRPPPIYEVVDKSGPDHAPRFQVAARVQGLDEGRGDGASRRAAEQAAAAAVISREGIADGAGAPNG